MVKSDFFYKLPKHLIAQKPLLERTASRLMYLDGEDGKIVDLPFVDLHALVNPGDLLVFNNTEVISARLFGRKETGGKVEVLIERIVSEKCVLAQIKANRSLKVGSRVYIDGDHLCCVTGREENLFVLEFEGEQHVRTILQQVGHIPLPPYIKRSDDHVDVDRYQTVYAEKPGAVAAPTAGLHFDLNTIEKLGQKGVNTTFITLHVGSGTFAPLRTENLDDHIMHPEVYEVPEHVVDQITSTRRQGGRVIAVGTTVVRALESASFGGKIRPFRGDTSLFIKPGYRFLCVDAMVTNFHLPESTLLILVCAFAGLERVMQGYDHAIKNQYRFFSYGDAMFVTKCPSQDQGF